jgi:serine/threonine protein phosphatase 1
MSEWVRRFARNTQGRDFVVGDLHGMFPTLRRLLADARFDPACDRLFSVGDLVDRGPASPEALDWLALPWFYACRGNHDQMVLDSTSEQDLRIWVTENGGEWWLKLSFADRARFRETFADLPYALEIATATGKVGIIHADIPPDLSWDVLLERLEQQDQRLALYLMWSRNRVQGNLPMDAVIEGVDRIYCGHTPVAQACCLGNLFYIDTGAAYGYLGYGEAKLTMVKIHPERHQVYTLPTANLDSNPFD